MKNISTLLILFFFILVGCDNTKNLKQIQESVTMERIKNHKEININDFKIIEEHYGCKVPQEVVDFLCRYNGQIKDEPDFDFKLENGEQISSFLDYIYDTQEIINEELEIINHLEVYQEDFKTPKDYVDAKTLFPIGGIMHGDIYISIDGVHNGKIYFADSENGITDLKLKLPNIIELIEGP